MGLFVCTRRSRRCARVRFARTLKVFCARALKVFLYADERRRSVQLARREIATANLRRRLFVVNSNNAALLIVGVRARLSSIHCPFALLYNLHKKYLIFMLI